MREDLIEVFGAREHNLKNIDVTIPRNKLVVITGLSGSGKSSLAFDTIYAEGQRRYIETFSAFARQFLGGLERADIIPIKMSDLSNVNKHSNMLIKNAYLVLLILLFSACNNQQAEKTEEPSPNNLVDGDTYDFGRVIKGDTLKTTFQLTNDLPKEIRIEDALGSSNHIKIRLGKKVLKPNESTIIDVELLTEQLNGSQKRKISIKTDYDEKPYFDYYILATIQDLKIHKKEHLFHLIKNKKEIADDLPRNFDFSENFTEKEREALNLQPEKIGSNEYYFLSDQKFLKEEIEDISFQIYYRNFYGNQLEKILRVKRTDTIYDITLSGIYSNGLDSSSLLTEFRNDMRFKKSWADLITVKDEPNIRAYNIDSIWTFYHFDNQLNLTKETASSSRYYKEIKENPETGKQDTLLEEMFSLGKINERQLVCGIIYSNYRNTLPEKISIYSVNDNQRKLLESFVNAGAYIDKMELFSLEGNQFINLSFSETSGIHYGIFYAVDSTTITLNKIKQNYINVNIPDSLQVFKGFGIMRNKENKFISGATLGSETSGRTYHFQEEHKLVKENGEFVFKSIDTLLNFVK